MKRHEQIVADLKPEQYSQFVQKTIADLSSETQVQYRKEIIEMIDSIDVDTIPVEKRRQAFLLFSDPFRRLLGVKKTLLILFTLSPSEMANAAQEALPIFNELEKDIESVTNLLCKLANVSELHVPISGNSQVDHFVVLKSTTPIACEPNSFTRVYPGI